MRTAIGFEIKILANLISRGMNEMSAAPYEEHGLTGMQAWVIGYVISNDNRDIFQRDIERDFNIRRATVSGVLQLMERDDLIVRVKVAHDARLKRITLTPKARRLHVQNVKRFMEFEKKICRGLSEEEMTTFCAIMEKLKTNLR